ncbi:MAG TPA: stage II sporulation protein M [Solirubrobacteraceae bacterium]|nr:stage II sporulation protein M [Solirubrobacteraceae bacterium]
MDVDRFVGERKQGWDELAALVREAGTRPQRLGAERLLVLGARYRAASADLALARRLFPGDPLARRLERLVADARQCVYATEPRRRSLRGFLTTGYWVRVRERPGPLAAGLLLLFVPMLLAAVWAIDDPAAALGIVPAEFEGVAEPGGGAANLSSDEAAAFASSLYTNNIQVTFLVIAGGIALGLGSAAVTIFNGGFIGALFGLTIEAGTFDILLRFVLPHGLLELSCIAVCCGAGLRLGWSMVDPGPLTRGASLRREARAAIEIVLGTMPWLVLAGLIEGFVSPNQPPLAVAALVGVAAAAPFWALVIWRGRPDHARPLALART